LHALRLQLPCTASELPSSAHYERAVEVNLFDISDRRGPVGVTEEQRLIADKDLVDLQVAGVLETLSPVLVVRGRHDPDDRVSGQRRVSDAGEVPGVTALRHDLDEIGSGAASEVEGGGEGNGSGSGSGLFGHCLLQMYDAARAFFECLQALLLTVTILS
jgi:hypothetical protein